MLQVNQSKAQKSRDTEMDNFQRTELQKEIVIQRLKERGCRMTAKDLAGCDTDGELRLL